MTEQNAESTEVDETVEEPKAEGTETEPTEGEKVQDEKTEESVETNESKGIDWKAEARKWENRSKENHSKVEELNTRVAELSEAESRVAATEAKLKEYKTEVAKYKLTAARYKSAMKHGLSEEDFDFLNGNTEEEIEAAAARLATRIGAGTRLSVRTQGTEPGDKPMSRVDEMYQKLREQS